MSDVTFLPAVTPEALARLAKITPHHSAVLKRAAVALAFVEKLEDPDLKASPDLNALFEIDDAITAILYPDLN